MAAGKWWELTVRGGLCRGRWRHISLPALAALACGGRAKAPPEASLPPTLVLRIDTVKVQATKPDSGEPWDGEAAQQDPGAGCKVLVGGVALFQPQVAPLSAICGLVDAPHLQRHPHDPDLQIKVAVGADVAYTSWIERDTTGVSLQYELVLPVGAVPSDGLRLEVLDDDGDQGRPELIGGIRLTVEQLSRAYESPSRLLVLSGGSVARLEVVILPYVNVPPETVQRQASESPTALGRNALAGEHFSIRAAGSFTVGSWYDERLDPSGYPGNEARSYNLTSFENEPHACVVALIGGGNAIEGGPIGGGSSFVAGHPGPLRLGLNDRDVSNNEGTLSFAAVRRAPTLEEWLARGRAR